MTIWLCSLQTCRAQEDMVAGIAFQLGVLMPLDTASFQLPSGYGITCLLMSSCLLPSRSSSSDWQVPWWCRGQIRSTLFLSAAHLARFYLFCLEFNSCSRHFMHLCHARHYSQEDMCIIGKEEEEDYCCDLRTAHISVGLQITTC